MFVCFREFSLAFIGPVVVVGGNIWQSFPRIICGSFHTIWHCEFLKQMKVKVNL